MSLSYHAGLLYCHCMRGGLTMKGSLIFITVSILSHLKGVLQNVRCNDAKPGGMTVVVDICIKLNILEGRWSGYFIFTSQMPYVHDVTKYVYWQAMILKWINCKHSGIFFNFWCYSKRAFAMFQEKKSILIVLWSLRYDFCFLCQIYEFGINFYFLISLILCDS